MTIYGLRYRPAPYVPTSTWRRLWPVARLEFGTLFRSKWGVALFLACLVPTFIWLIMLLVQLQVLSFGAPQARRVMARPELRQFDPLQPDYYVEIVVSPDRGLLVFLLLTALVTARAIAKDRATNALELYWTRGISPRGYFVAKWFGSFLLAALPTVAGPFVLWVTGAFLWEDWSHFETTWRFMPRALAALATFTGALTAICILLSAIAGSPNLAMILWCMLLGGTSALAHVVSEVARAPAAVSWLSVWDAAGTLAREIAGIPERRASAVGAIVLLGGLSLGLLALVRRRLRLQEAVG